MERAAHLGSWRSCADVAVGHQTWTRGWQYRRLMRGRFQPAERKHFPREITEARDAAGDRAHIDSIRPQLLTRRRPTYRFVPNSSRSAAHRSIRQPPRPRRPLPRRCHALRRGTSREVAVPAARPTRRPRAAVRHPSACLHCPLQLLVWMSSPPAVSASCCWIAANCCTVWTSTRTVGIDHFRCTFRKEREEYNCLLPLWYV